MRPRPEPAPAAALGVAPPGAAVVLVGGAAVDEELEPVAEGVAEVQVTAVGTTTPSELQNWMANCTAACWSASLHVPVRQHAMPERKFLSRQMHAASSDWHPPIWSPVVNLFTQPCCLLRKGGVSRRLRGPGYVLAERSRGLRMVGRSPIGTAGM